MAEMGSAPRGTHARRHGAGERTSWIAGVILIVLGGAFLLEQNGYVVLTGNWWAVFIYLAAVGAFVNAWRSYRANGEFGRSATGSLVWALVLTVVATVFALNLLWDLWWPAILIAVGVGILTGYFLNAVTQKPEDTDEGS